MKNLLIEPPQYVWEELDSSEYAIGLLKLASFLKSKGEEVSYFDFIPYKYFRSNKITLRDDDNFDIAIGNNDPQLYRSYVGQENPVHRTTLCKKTGEYISRLGFTRNRWYLGVDKNIFTDYLKRNKPDKIWVSSGITYGYKGTVDLINWCKEIYPDVEVVLGGIYPSLCFEHALAHTKADIIFGGECAEFKDMPMDYSVLPNHPQYIVRQLTKGCPNRCKFCAVTYLDGSVVRFVDIDRDIREIKEFSETYNCNKIKLWGSNLLLPGRGKMFEEWLDKLIALDKNFEIVCPEGFSPELLTVDICRKLKRAGFGTVIIPLEEADNDHLVGGLGKKYSVDVWRSAIDKAVEAGIERENIQVPIIAGSKGQTVENLQKALDIYAETGVRPSIAKYVPVPKSQWYEEDEELKSIDLELLHGSLYPAIRDCQTYLNMSKIIGVLMNSLIQNYQKGIRDYMENEKKDQPIPSSKDVIAKMAVILVDIAEQNNTIIDLLTKLVEGKK